MQTIVRFFYQKLLTKHLFEIYNTITKKKICSIAHYSRHYHSYIYLCYEESGRLEIYMNTQRKNYKKSYHGACTSKLIILCVLSVIVIACTFITFSVKGSTEQKQKLFTTLKIEQGDSLWSIAEEYYTTEYSDYNEYIDEIKSINNMKDDTLKKGSYIVVPYYSDDIIKSAQVQ